jgi:hypothetical protein
MIHYADSSFLVSCYVLDANTPLAKAYLSRTRAPLAWTALHALEVRNAFELGLFRGLLTKADVAAAWLNLEPIAEVDITIKQTDPHRPISSSGSRLTVLLLSSRNRNDRSFDAGLTQEILSKTLPGLLLRIS